MIGSSSNKSPQQQQQQYRSGLPTPPPQQQQGYPQQQQQAYPPNAGYANQAYGRYPNATVSVGGNYGGAYPQGQTQQQQPVYNMTNANPQASVIAPGMLNPMAPRKAIPTADNNNNSAGNHYNCILLCDNRVSFDWLVVMLLGGSSGFSFMGSAPNGSNNSNNSNYQQQKQNDSFNFVSDAMKNMQK